MQAGLPGQEEDVIINCIIHGKTGPAILCSHLAEARMGQVEGLGWVQAELDPENRKPVDLMAWCADCDKVYEQDAGWNAQNDSRFKVVCGLCLVAIKENQGELQHAPIRP